MLANQERRVGELAAEAQASKCLSASLSDDERTLLEGLDGEAAALLDGALVFSSEEARNELAAQHNYNAVLAIQDHASIDFFKSAHSLWRHEIGLPDKASGRLMAMYSAHTDLFADAAAILSDGAMGVFDILHIIEAALQYIARIHPDTLVEFTKLQHASTKNDLMGGRFYTDIEEWLARNPGQLEGVLRAVKEAMSPEVAPVYNAAMLAWARLEPDLAGERALEDAHQQKAPLSSNALWVLGTLIGRKTLSARVRDEAWTLLEKFTNSAPEDEFRQAAVGGIGRAALALEESASKLLDLALKGERSALYSISDLVAFQKEAAKAIGFYDRWIACLAKVPAADKGTIENFDWAAADLVKTGSAASAIQYIEQWVEQCAMDGEAVDPVKAFDSTFLELFNAPLHTANILTSWLSSESGPLVDAADAVIKSLSLHGMQNVEFDSDLLADMSGDKYRVLICRMLGIVANEEILLSLVMSTLKKKIIQRHGTNLFIKAIIEEIGLDYPEATLIRLKAVKGLTNQAKDAVRRAIDALALYWADLDALPKAPELRPSTKAEQAFYKARARMMERYREKAEEKSIIRQLATVIPLKAGRSTFSRVEGKLTAPSNLGTFSASVTLPRRHVLDPVGYDIHRLVLRNAKLKEGAS